MFLSLAGCLLPLSWLLIRLPASCSLDSGRSGLICERSPGCAEQCAVGSKSTCQVRPSPTGRVHIYYYYRTREFPGQLNQSYRIRTFELQQERIRPLNTLRTPFERGARWARVPKHLSTNKPTLDARDCWQRHELQWGACKARTSGSSARNSNNKLELSHIGCNGLLFHQTALIPLAWLAKVVYPSSLHEADAVGLITAIQSARNVPSFC